MHDPDTGRLLERILDAVRHDWLYFVVVAELVLISALTGWLLAGAGS